MVGRQRMRRLRDMTSVSRITRRSLVAAAAAIALLAGAVPDGSAAGAECGFDESLHRLHILLPYGGTSVLRRGDEGALLVDGAACPGATVDSVDTIVAGIRGTSMTTATTLVIDLSGGPLAPGFTDEPGGSDEIELERTPHDIDGVGRLADYGRLIVRGTGADERMTAGQLYANLDATETDGIDGDAYLPQFVVLEGRGGDDVLTGAGGDGTGPYSHDVELDGGPGADRLTGGSGTDTLNGGEGDDIANGGGSFDRLIGGPGDDALTGGVSDRTADTFDGGAGADVFTGEPTYKGGDSLSYAGDPSGVVVDLAAGVATDGHGDVDTFTNAFGVTGSAHDDRLVARATGGGSLGGGAGDDTLIGGAGDDWIGGDDGDDVLQGGDGGDRLTGLAGDDVLDAGPGDDELLGGRDDDSHDGGAGRDHVSYAEEWRDVTADLATDRAVLEDGVVESIAGTEDLTAQRCCGNVVHGDAGPNRLVGTTVRGGPGDDDLDARLYDFSDAPSGIVIGEGTMLTDGWGDSDELGDTYGIRGTAFADRVEDPGEYGYVTFEGGAGDDVYVGSNELGHIRGGPGADVLTGGTRHDVIDGGPGPDTIDFGPAGTSNSPGDTLTFADSSSGVVVDLEAGTAIELGGVDTFTAPTLVFGSPHGDVVRGTAGADVIDPGAGDDTVQAGGGDDVLTAGAGVDDWTGGDGRDVLSYKDATEAVDLDLAAGTVAADGDGASDAVAGVEEVHGSDYGDDLRGDEHDNVLLGRGSRGGGGDFIAGRAGDDVLDAGTKHAGGTPRYDGGPGDDVFKPTWSTTTLAYHDAAGGIELDVAAGSAQDGDGGVDTFPAGDSYTVLGSDHDDRVAGVHGFYGLDGDDVAIGDEGRSWLYGGSGDDRLEGRGDDDGLRGDGGSDVLLGGDGDDDVDADDQRDGVFDPGTDDVGCGAGADAARADAADAVNTDCEDVDRAAAPPPPPREPDPEPEPEPEPDPDDGDGGNGTPDPGDGTGTPPGDDTTDAGLKGDGDAQPRPVPPDPALTAAAPPAWSAPPPLAPRSAAPPRDVAAPRGTVRLRRGRLVVRTSEAVTARITVRRCASRGCTRIRVLTRRLRAGRSIVTLPKAARRARGISVVVRLVDAAGHAATIRSR